MFTIVFHLHTFIKHTHHQFKFHRTNKKENKLIQKKKKEEKKKVF